MTRTKTNRDSAERRSRQRFCIGQDVSYTCLYGTRMRGVGKVIDISSRGVRFTTEAALSLGTGVELSIDWPARISHTCLLKLIVCGCVVRSEASFAVITIEHHEFRTKALQGVPISTRDLSYPKILSELLTPMPCNRLMN